MPSQVDRPRGKKATSFFETGSPFPPHIWLVIELPARSVGMHGTNVRCRMQVNSALHAGQLATKRKCMPPSIRGTKKKKRRHRDHQNHPIQTKSRERIETSVAFFDQDVVCSPSIGQDSGPEDEGKKIESIMADAIDRLSPELFRGRWVCMETGLHMYVRICIAAGRSFGLGSASVWAVVAVRATGAVIVSAVVDGLAARNAAVVDGLLELLDGHCESRFGRDKVGVLETVKRDVDG
ncbi:hypothetical protein QBC43DRAFT_316165 [Cladorrhinum sp. PSN259]|nr:hypothetical protein QBC43DRAFT_316165 [Cladorrhinum sp. PSN259]